MIKYIEVHTLENRGPVDPAPSSEIDGLLRGTAAVLEFDCNHSSYGCDWTTLFPAWYEGKRAWLRRDEWQAAYGYSASGTSECILSFEDGVKLFLERGVFEFPKVEERM